MIEAVESAIAKSLPNNACMMLQLNYAVFNQGKSGDVYVRKGPSEDVPLEYGFMVASQSEKKKREFSPNHELREKVIAILKNPLIFGYDVGYGEGDISLAYEIDRSIYVVNIYQQHFETLYNRIYKEWNTNEFIIRGSVPINKRLIDLFYKLFDDYTISNYLDLMNKKVNGIISSKRNRDRSLLLYRIFGTYIPILAHSTCLLNPMLTSRRARSFVEKSQLYVDANRHQVNLNGLYVSFITNEKLCYDMNSKRPFVMFASVANQLLLSLVSDSELLPSVNSIIYVNDDGFITKDVYNSLPNDEKAKYLEMDKLRYLCIHSNPIRTGISSEDMYDSLKNISLIAKKEV